MAQKSVLGGGGGMLCWRDSETSNSGALMHRVPDDCNVLQLSSTVSLLLQSTVHYHFGLWAISLWALTCALQVKWRRLKLAGHSFFHVIPKYFNPSHFWTQNSLLLHFVCTWELQGGTYICTHSETETFTWRGKKKNSLLIPSEYKKRNKTCNV